MRYFIVVLLLLSVTCLSAQVEKQSSLKKLEWLVGDWKGSYSGGAFYESWRKVNDSVMVNFVIEIKNSDTLVKENGYIRLTGNGIIHKGGRDSWTLDKLSDDEMVFRNDTLKYANLVTWSHSKNDHWLTVIKNPASIINYDLERVPWPGRVVDGFINRMRRN